MFRSILGLTLAVLAAAPAPRAQSAYDCVPDIEAQIFGPIPVELPEPFAGASATSGPHAASALATARPVVRAASPLRRPAPGAGRRPAHTAARGGVTECPTLARYRIWDGTGWGPDELRVDATYDAAGRTLDAKQRFNTTAGFQNSRDVYAYDAAGHPTSVLSEDDEDDDGVYESGFRETYTYDGAGHLAGLLAEERVGAAWLPRYRAAVASGAGPYATGFVTDEWDGTAWVPSYRGTFTYTADSRRLASTYEFWNGSTWEGESRETWSYDGAGRAVSVTHDLPAGPGAWAPYGRTLYAYDGARLASWTDQRLIGPDVWRDEVRVEYAYDGDGRLATLTLSSALDTDTLEPVYRDRYTHDARGLAETTFDQWTEEGTWDALYRTLFTRDAEGRATEAVGQRREGAAWVNESSSLYSYDGTVAGEAAPGASAPTLTVGPNPAAASATVRYTLAAPGAVRLTLTDVLGREVAVLADGERPAGPHEASFDAGRLAPGVYVVRLTAASGPVTRRVTVVR